MTNILMITEAYGGGIKTHFDLISKYKKEFTDKKIFFCISESRLENEKENSLKECIVNNNLSEYKKVLNLKKNLDFLDEIVESNQIDIIHVHSTIAGLLCRIYTFLYNKKIKVIYTPHGYFSQGSYSFWKKKIIVFIEKFIESNVHTIHVSSGENNHSKLNKISKYSTIINNGTETLKGKTYSSNKNKFTVGYLGRAEEPKNVERFVEIANSYNKIYPDSNVDFLFGGMGKNLDLIRNEVEVKKIKNVTLTGFIDKETFFNKIDVYMSTSKYEGLPFSVIEAMSFGKPLILSEINGHLDFKKSSATNLFNLNKKNKDIAHGIHEFIHNDSFLDYKEQIFKEFETNFSVEKMIKNIDKLYDSIINDLK